MASCSPRPSSTWPLTKQPEPFTWRGNLGREDKRTVQEPLRALGFVICADVDSKASRMAESGVHTEA